MLTAEQIQNELPNFYGTQNYHLFNGLFRRTVCTDGTIFLAKEAGAYWLMELIASYQGKLRAKLGGFQVWKLKKNKTGHGCKVTCEDGNGNAVKTQRVSFTDFPLDEITLYCCVGDVGGQMVDVIMLPSEY